MFDCYYIKRFVVVAGVLAAFGFVEVFGAGASSNDASLFPVRVCALMESQDASVRKVGFVNDKTGDNFVLTEGAFLYSFEIIDIDMTNERVIIFRDGERKELFLKGGKTVNNTRKLSKKMAGIGRTDPANLKKLKNSDAGKMMGSSRANSKSTPPPGFESLVSR